jgi:hypothetical protein
MEDIASSFMSLASPWGLVATVIFAAAGFIGWAVTSIIKARECRQLRLQNEKAELEIKLLKLEVARRGIAISVPGAEELDAALRDRAAFSSLKTLGKASDLTRASKPDPAYEQYSLYIREKMRSLMIWIGVVSAAACFLISVALWW